MTRRKFFAVAGAGAVMARAASEAGLAGQVCLFSKHLPDMPYPELARTIKQLGFAGVDLTVRPGGHVLPERVVEDLPRAVAALREGGVAVPMITTGLTSVDDPAARPTLVTAARLGIPFYKLGYYRYRTLAELQATLDRTRREVERLVALGRETGIQAGFHNHSGTYVGAAVWDAFEILRHLDPKWIGCYFDPCHATIEGGMAGWNIGFHRLADRIKMVAVKDFVWGKAKGKWTAEQCPLGEGMVDWKTFFRQLVAIGFRGPISMHLEYEIEGATAAAKAENNLRAIRRDLAALKAKIEESRA
jgi:sugar phosphate isomerase/epimerase